MKKDDYRLIRLYPLITVRNLWGCDVFVWHFPILKAILLVALIGWFLG